MILTERLKNVCDVYDVFNKKIIENKNILLVDDVVTTGATMNECANILKLNGAKKVLCAALAASCKF